MCAGLTLFFIFFREPDAHRDADDRCAGEEGDPGPACFGADMTMDKEDRADDRVEETPDDVDGSGGEALTRRFGEGGREFVTGNPLGEMGDGIGEEDAGEKCAEIDSEDHVTDLL